MSHASSSYPLDSIVSVYWQHTRTWYKGRVLEKHDQKGLLIKYDFEPSASDGVAAVLGPPPPVKPAVSEEWLDWAEIKREGEQLIRKWEPEPPPSSSGGGAGASRLKEEEDDDAADEEEEEDDEEGPRQKTRLSASAISGGQQSMLRRGPSSSSTVLSFKAAPALAGRESQFRFPLRRGPSSSVSLLCSEASSTFLDTEAFFPPPYLPPPPPDVESSFPRSMAERSSARVEKAEPAKKRSKPLPTPPQPPPPPSPKKKHASGTIHACPQKGCKYATSRVDNLSRHNANVHSIGAVWFPCPYAAPSSSSSSSPSSAAAAAAPSCSFSTKDKSSLRQHLANIHDIGVTWHVCGVPRCKYRSKQSGARRQHRIAIHGIDDQSEDVGLLAPQTKGGGKGKDTEDSKVGKEAVKKRRSDEGVEGGKEAETKKSKTGRRKPKVEEEAEKAAAAPAVHPCDYPGCTYSAKRLSHLKEHMANVHDVGVTWHVCDRKGCVFKSKTAGNLRQHQAAVHGKRKT